MAKKPAGADNSAKKKLTKKEYRSIEDGVINLLSVGTELTVDGKHYVVTENGKPSCGSGEPKTDAYARAVADDGTTREFKISVKASNADFFENKISAARAEEIFGDEWSDRLKAATPELTEVVSQRQLIDKEGHGRTEAGSMILGWRADIMNKPSGAASVPFVTDEKTKLEIITGENSSDDKRNALVNGSKVDGSGIANLVFHADNGVPRDASELIARCVTPEQEAKSMPDMYLAAKAVNYRMLKNKYDGNRPLLISANYQRTDDGKLCIDIDGDHPLEHGATEMFFKLHDTLEECGIKGIEELPDEYETRIGGSGGVAAVTSAAKTPSSQKTMKRSESSGKKKSGNSKKNSTRKKSSGGRTRVVSEEPVWVEPHMRAGHPVKGHYRKRWHKNA